MQCCFKCRRGSWPLLIFAICLSIAAPASSYLLLIFPLQMSWIQQSPDDIGVVVLTVVVLVFLAFYLLLIFSLMSIELAVLTLVVAMPLCLPSHHLFKCFHFLESWAHLLSSPMLIHGPDVTSWSRSRIRKPYNWQHFFTGINPWKPHDFTLECTLLFLRAL